MIKKLILCPLFKSITLDPEIDEEEEARCESDQFSCDNNCFDNNQRCDGHPDCSDGADERSCEAHYKPVRLLNRKK